MEIVNVEAAKLTCEDFRVNTINLPVYKLR